MFISNQIDIFSVLAIHLPFKGRAIWIPNVAWHILTTSFCLPDLINFSPNDKTSALSVIQMNRLVVCHEQLLNLSDHD